MSVHGITSREVFEPASIEEACTVIARLGREKRTMMFMGGGTKLSLGAPPTELDAIVRTTRLARIVEYAPSDQVVTVEAGITLEALQERLAGDRQRLSLDAPWPERATLGGIVATNSFGPLRARSGAVRDLVLGVSLIRADGVLARGGGRVVKNVAGFDLPKLVCGSLGTLALIAAVTLRVHPLPEASEVRVVRGLDAEAVVRLTQSIRLAQLEPSALLARRAGAAWELGLLFEGFAPAVGQQITQLQHLCEPVIDEEPSLFSKHRSARENAGLRLKIAALPNALPAVERALDPFGRQGELAWYPSLGLGFFSAASDFEARTLLTARDALRALGGTLTVEEASPSLRESCATWSDPSALALHRAIKSRFDPERLLAPGRFVGGI